MPAFVLLSGAPGPSRRPRGPGDPCPQSRREPRCCLMAESQPAVCSRRGHYPYCTGHEEAFPSRQRPLAPSSEAAGPTGVLEKTLQNQGHQGLPSRSRQESRGGWGANKLPPRGALLSFRLSPRLSGLLDAVQWVHWLGAVYCNDTKTATSSFLHLYL